MARLAAHLPKIITNTMILNTRPYVAIFLSLSEEEGQPDKVSYAPILAWTDWGAPLIAGRYGLVEASLDLNFHSIREIKDTPISIQDAASEFKTRVSKSKRKQEYKLEEPEPRDFIRLKDPSMPPGYSLLFYKNTPKCGYSWQAPSGYNSKRKFIEKRTAIRYALVNYKSWKLNNV